MCRRLVIRYATLFTAEILLLAALYVARHRKPWMRRVMAHRMASL